MLEIVGYFGIFRHANPKMEFHRLWTNISLDKLLLCAPPSPSDFLRLSRAIARIRSCRCGLMGSRGPRLAAAYTDGCLILWGYYFASELWTNIYFFR